MSTSPPPTAPLLEDVPPPSYTEAVATGSVTYVEQRSPTRLNGGSQYSSSHGSDDFTCRNFLMLWLGIGYQYAYCCSLVPAIFFGAGVAVVVLAAVVGGSGCQPMQVLTVAAGGLFVFLSTLWPCAWYWHKQNQQRRWRFTPVLCYALILSLFYVGIAAALASQVYEHRIDDCSSAITFWVLMIMAVFLVVFTTCSTLLCVCYRAAGRFF